MSRMSASKAVSRHHFVIEGEPERRGPGRLMWTFDAGMP
jgi:hypothetical protein